MPPPYYPTIYYNINITMYQHHVALLAQSGLFVLGVYVEKILRSTLFLPRDVAFP
jgi:hypothetical protein